MRIFACTFQHMRCTWNMQCTAKTELSNCPTYQFFHMCLCVCVCVLNCVGIWNNNANRNAHTIWFTCADLYCWNNTLKRRKIKRKPNRREKQKNKKKNKMQCETTADFVSLILCAIHLFVFSIFFMISVDGQQWIFFIYIFFLLLLIFQCSALPAANPSHWHVRVQWWKMGRHDNWKVVFNQHIFMVIFVILQYREFIYSSHSESLNE